MHIVEDCYGVLDTLFQGRGGGVHDTLRNGHQADEVSQIGNAAFEPAVFGETATIVIQDGVGKAGGCQRTAQVSGETDGIGIAQSDGSLYWMAFAYHRQAEAAGGVALGGAYGFVFGFDHHGRAVGGGNQIVQLQARIAGDQPGVFGADLAAEQHPTQQVAELVIDAGFAVAGLLAGHTTSALAVGYEDGDMIQGGAGAGSTGELSP